MLLHGWLLFVSPAAEAGEPSIDAGHRLEELGDDVPGDYEYDEYDYESDDYEYADEADAASLALGSEAWLSSGLRYDRNLSINPDRIDRTSSPIFSLDLYGYDQNRYFTRGRRSEEAGWELRSIGYVDFDIDLLDNDRDYQSVSAQTGPVFHIRDEWDLYTSIGGGFSFFGYDFYTGLAAVYLSMQSLAGAPLRSVNLDVGYENTGDAFGGGNAPWIDLYATLGWDGLLFDTDWVEFTPLAEYYHANPTVYRYGQLEGTLAYGFGLNESTQATAWLTGFRRVYYGDDEGRPTRRRDWFLLAQLGVLYSGLIRDSLSLELVGSYEQNWSTFDEESYQGGSIGLTLHWVFLSLGARGPTPGARPIGGATRTPRDSPSGW